MRRRHAKEGIHLSLQPRAEVPNIGISFPTKRTDVLHHLDLFKNKLKFCDEIPPLSWCCGVGKINRQMSWVSLHLRLSDH